MFFNINEVQVSFIILMGLITLFMSFVLPTYKVAGKHYNRAMKILSVGTFLLMVHFIVQYVLRKQSGEITVISTIINLLFGIPISYCVNMSYIYMQLKKKVSVHDWLFGPFIFFIEISVLLISWKVSKTEASTRVAMYIMSLLYAVTIFYYVFVILHQCFLPDITTSKRKELLPYVKHIHWSVILTGLLAFGYPLMTFVTNLMMRSIIGQMAIMVFFYYIFSFIIYGIKYNNGIPPQPLSSEKEPEEEKVQLSAVKLERMNTAISQFVKNEMFTKSSLTMKETADAMGVSMNMLKIWLRNSKYEKYNSWITALRIEKAKELLLKNPDISYDEISNLCGFCDRQYFYRLFKKQEGVSPSNWIKERIITNGEQNK